MAKIKNENAKEIGKRVLAARKLTGMSLHAFSKKYKLNYYTMRNWELGASVSSEKGIKNWCLCLRQEGVICSVEWVLTGQSGPPQKLAEPVDEEDFAARGYEEEILKEEIEYFIERHRQAEFEAVVCEVEDTSMMPLYHVGEYLGGVIIPKSELKLQAGVTYLFETEKDKFAPRTAIQRDDAFLLFPTNLKYKIEGLNKSMRIAKIVWRRVGLV